MSLDEPTYDCRACGACCAADYAGQAGYVQMTPGDVLRLSPRYRHLHVVDHAGRSLSTARDVTNYGGGYLKTKDTKKDGTVCVALRGSVWSGRVSCGIYARRPSICRTFEPGDSSCRFARRMVGFDEPER